MSVSQLTTVKKKGRRHYIHHVYQDFKEKIYFNEVLKTMTSS